MQSLDRRLSQEALSALPVGDILWVALVAVSSIVFSLALACATPFAAIAAVAATRMRRRDAFSLVAVTWFSNQAVGYLVLGYPRTWDSFAWGGAIGLAAGLATFAAMAATLRLRVTLLPLATPFLAAFLSYEVVLFAMTAILPSGAAAFSIASVCKILAINLSALAVLLILHRLAAAIGLIAALPQLSANRA